MYAYRVYGLHCASNVSVPSLQPGSALDSPDLRIELNTSAPAWVRHRDHPYPFEYRPVATGTPDGPCTITRLEEEKYFEITYRDGVQFAIDGAANRVWASCPESLTLEDLCTYLVGPVMGFILRLRGILCLHASSVSIAGHAVALCGESQSGKSTTAAALALRGISVLGEDVTPVKESVEEFVVEPGYPRICLWPDSVTKLLGSADALPLITPTWEKRFLPLDGAQASFEAKPKPLGAIYLLCPRTNDADAPRVEEVSPRDRFLTLVQNTYMNWLLNRDQRAAEFDILANIVQRVPVRRIIPHADPARLAALCDLIVEDAIDAPGGPQCTSITQSA